VRSRGPLPVAQKKRSATDPSDALRPSPKTHRFNLVHRDIKPSKILVTPEEQAKLWLSGWLFLSRHVPGRA